MQLTKTNNSFEEEVKYINTLGEVKAGEFYIMNGEGIQAKEHRGEKLVLIDETNTEKGIMFITDEKGNQPFAVLTNDSFRDDMNTNKTLSSVIAKVGYKIFVASHSENKQPTKIYGFKILGIDPHKENGDLRVTCFHAESSLYTIDGHNNAYKHAIKALRQKDVKVQLQDKYCFQTTRRVHLCLMVRDENNELVCRRNGKVMTLNNHSYAKRDLMGDVHTEGFFRVYYSKRFENSPLVYVEGVKVDDASMKIDPEEYLRSAETDLSESLHVITTLGGMEFYAIITPRGEIRPIIKLGTFISFTLSEEEIKDSVESIVKYSDSNKVINI